MNYTFWVTYCIIYYIITAILAKWLNDDKWLGWFWIAVILQLFSIWPFVALRSRSILFDGMLLDTIILICYYGTFLVMGAGRGFSWVQWVACGMVMVGLFIMKLG